MVQVNEYPPVPFENDFIRKFRWSQGEHLTVVAPTGRGKTTLLSRLLPMRRNVVIFGTKFMDPTFKEFKGYEVYREWPKRGDVPSHHRRIVLWPEYKGTLAESKKNQQRVFEHALNRIFVDHGWTVVFDEEHYLSKDLGFGDEIATYLHQGRSSGLTVVTGTQRPAWVPVVTYSASTHAFLWKNTHAEDMKRLANLGGIDAKELAHNMLRLGKYDFIYVNTAETMAPIRSNLRS